MWQGHLDAAAEFLKQKNSSKAEQELQTAVELTKSLPPEDPGRLKCLSYLAKVYLEQDKYTQAQQALEQHLTLLKLSPEKNQMQTIHDLTDLAKIALIQEKFVKVDYLDSECLKPCKIKSRG